MGCNYVNPSAVPTRAAFMNYLKQWMLRSKLQLRCDEPSFNLRVHVIFHTIWHLVKTVAIHLSEKSLLVIYVKNLINLSDADDFLKDMLYPDKLFRILAEILVMIIILKSTNGQLPPR